MLSSHKQILWVSCIFCWILQQISEFLLRSSHEEIVEKEEEMQPIKNFLRKAIPLFFHLALHAFPDIGLVGWIKKKETKKKSQEVSE